MSDEAAAEIPAADQVPPDPEPKGEETTGSGKREPAASTVLVELAHEAYELGRTDTGDVYATAPKSPVVRMLRAGKQGLRAELADAYYRRTGRAAPQQALADSLLVLEGSARQVSPRQVHLRVAAHGPGIYVDTGDTDERVIRIGADGWALLETGAPVLFRRTALTGAFPMPVSDAGLEALKALWELVNVAAEDRPLVLAWLVHALISPDTPHPILSLVAEQGSGKSSATKVLAALVDPSPVPLRKPPKDPETWITAASASWVVALDNVSSIQPWLSDTLCRAATGDGDVRRALYTDGDVAVFAFRRCVIVNGITLGALAGDYAERSLAVKLHRIAPENRRTEAELAQYWAEQYPRVLGALLTLCAGTMAAFPYVRLGSSPRMADYARTLAAVDKVLDTDGLERYRQAAAALAVESLESEPFILHLLDHLAEEFTGTAAVLLAKVRCAEVDGKPPAWWPKTARKATDLITRNAPGLRAAGWQIADAGRVGRNHTKQWTLTPAPGEGPESSPASPACPCAQVKPGIWAGQHGNASPAGSPALPAPRASAGDRGQRAGDAKPPRPHEKHPLTSSDGQAGDAGDDSGLSPVDNFPAICEVCQFVLDEGAARNASAVCTDCAPDRHGQGSAA